MLILFLKITAWGYESATSLHHTFGNKFHADPLGLNVMKYWSVFMWHMYAGSPRKSTVRANKELTVLHS
jgi:hypothetical protein